MFAYIINRPHPTEHDFSILDEAIKILSNTMNNHKSILTKLKYEPRIAEKLTPAQLEKIVAKHNTFVVAGTCVNGKFTLKNSRPKNNTHICWVCLSENESIFDTLLVFAKRVFFQKIFKLNLPSINMYAICFVRKLDTTPSKDKMDMGYILEDYFL